MFVSHDKNIPKLKVESPEAKEAFRQVLVGPDQGWQGWVMRLFTLAEGGYSPRHEHPWPHINYIVSGRGTLFIDGEEHRVEKGSTAYVPAGALHQFLNRGTDEFVFICIVPEEGDR
jgi:quercetin dioxygenase-like cupin family protein